MKKRGLSLLLALCMLLSVFSALPITASAASSGQCGDNVYWTLDDNGTLTISGTGDMWDYTYGEAPWQYISMIKNVSVKYGVTKIGNFAFCGQDELTQISISNSVTSIGDGAFANLYKLININIPDGVMSIGNNTFSSCYSLESIRIPDSVTNIGFGAFVGCSSLITIKIPKGIDTIKYNTFAECGLRNIDIPRNVISIEQQAFINCKNLVNVNIENGVTNINSHVFYGCNKLRNITIPGSIKEIGYAAFSECNSLTDVNILNGVEYIGFGAFANCTDLESVFFPVSLTNIAYNAFVNCNKLKDIYYSGSIKEYRITIEGGNSPLENATIHYNSTAHSQSTSLGAPVIKSASITYKDNTYDLFSQPISMEQNSDIEISITPDVDFSGNSNVKIYLTQGAVQAAELKNGVPNAVQPGNLFSDGDIYLLAVDTDTGNSTALKTKLNVSKTKSGELFPDSGADRLNFTLGKKVGFTIPDSVAIFGGTEISWDFGFIPISVEYDKEDNNKINIVFGANITSEGEKDKDGKVTTKYFKDFNFKEYKKNIKKYKEDIKKASKKQKRTLKQIKNDYKMTKDKKFSLFGDKIFGGGKGSIDPTIDVAGYAEMKVVDGELKLTEGQLCVEAEIMFNYQGQIFIWVVPCYYEIGGGVEAGLEGNMININPDGFTPEFDAYITTKVMAKIGGGIGVAQTATVGASGEGSLNLKQALNKDYLKAWGEGAASFEVKFFGKKVAEKPFAEGDFLIYETGSNKGLIKDKAVSIQKANKNNMLNSVNLSETYPNESRSYAENPTVWQPQRPAMLRSAAIDYSNKELKKLASNVYTETKPMICNINGTKVMVMQWDSAQRADIDRTMLVYSVYDEDIGSWSEPTAVDDDGTADFYPCFKDGYLVWQNSKTLLSDDMTLEDIAKTGEICIAKWNGNGFDQTEVLTDNETLDTLPTVCADGDTVNATWITNSNNDILGITGRNTIVQKTCTNGEWSEVSEVKTDLNSVISLSSGYANNKYSIAYVEDGDNDFDTMNDRNIIVIADGAETNITDNGTLNSNPVFADNRIYYYSAGNIVSANVDGSDKQNIFNEAKQGLTDNFVVDTNSNGDKAVWWTKAQSGAAEVYSALYRDNEWSDEINVTSLGNTAKYPSGILNDDGTMLVAFTGGITENNEITQTDLYTVSVAPSYDLEMTDAYIDEETMTVYATVKNSGELAVNSYTVSLDDGGTNNSVTVTEALPAGGTKEVEIAYNKPSDFTKHTITATVSADNKEEYNLNNNSAEISVGLSDVSIVSVDSYEKLPSSSAVVAIENKGNCDAENVILSLRKETENGEAVNEMNIGTLAAGEEKSVTIDYEPLKYENVLWYVTVQTDSDEITTANNAEYFVNESSINLAETEHKILNYNINDTTLSVNTFVKNNTETQLAGNVYAAVYSSKNELVGVAVQPINVSGYGDTGVDLWINNYTKHDGDYIKAFIWDEKQTPKCGVDIQNIQ